MLKNKYKIHWSMDNGQGHARTLVTGWRCPMDPTMKSFVATPSQAPSPVVQLDQP